jgi:hypothetical protein
MKQICPLLLVLCCACSSNKPATEDKRSELPEEQRLRAKSQADEIGKALSNEDYETVVKYTYPLVVEKLGGRQKMIDVLKTGMGGMKAQGIRVESVTIEAPKDIVAGGSNLFAILPQHLVMSRPGGKITSDTYLVAVSSDKGKNWTFIDGANLSKEKINTILPDFPASLKLPEVRKPVVD